MAMPTVRRSKRSNIGSSMAGSIDEAIPSSTVPAPASPHRCSTRSEEHTSELQSLMSISYAVFCLNKTQPHSQTIISSPSSHTTAYHSDSLTYNRNTIHITNLDSFILYP